MGVTSNMNGDIRNIIKFLLRRRQERGRRKCSCGWNNYIKMDINPLKTKRRLLYLKTRSVPRCKHFSSRL